MSCQELMMVASSVRERKETGWEGWSKVRTGTGFGEGIISSFVWRGEAVVVLSLGIRYLP